MKTPDNPQQTPYLNQREQIRLLSMVSLFTLVVFGIHWASQSENWHWILPPQDEQQSNPEYITQQIPPVSSDKSDTPVDVFEIPPQWLDSIRDDAMGLRANEANSYFKILAHIKRLNEDHLKERARNDVVLANLMNFPNDFRGNLIHLNGIAKKIRPLPVQNNEYGIRQTYEAWVLTSDSAGTLWRVVFNNLKNGIPTGDNLNIPIESSGYFFKKQTYASQKGSSQSPLLLAASIVPYQPPEHPVDASPLTYYIAWLAGVVMLLTLVVVTIYSRGDRQFKQQLKQKFPEDEQQTEEFLNDLNQVEQPNSLID